MIDSIYKHYLFDINMFTHLNITSNVAFTTGEQITGDTSGATGTIRKYINTIFGSNINNFSCKSRCSYFWFSAHNLKEGQQITFDVQSAEDSGVAITTSDVFTVRNVQANVLNYLKQMV